MYKIIISLFVLKTACYAQNIANSTSKNFVYGQYNYDTSINVVVSNGTEHILDFFEVPKEYQVYPTRVKISTNTTIPLDYPVFVTATQQKGISSWELPIVLQTDTNNVLLYDMAHTLCPFDSGPDMKSEHSPTIHITTQNPGNTSVGIQLTRVDDFYIEVNKEISVNVTPSTPQYYYFSFEQNPWNISHPLLQRGLPIFNYTIPKSVILIIESDDELCAAVSIQNNSCPVFDDQKDILYQGDHLTMSTKGGITLTQSMFPAGFYVVLVVKERDVECTGVSETDTMLGANALNRVKNFRFRIIATISYKEYVIGALVIVALVMLVAAFVVLVALRYSLMTKEEIIIEEQPGPSTSQLPEQPSSSHTLLNDDDDDDDDDDDPSKDVAVRPWAGAAPLTVARLTQAPPYKLAKRSDRYFWGALTVAVVYALPVVQLLFTYQRMVFQTGNQDLCYYNFLCAHPAGFLSDFNHVYSNIAYVIFGLVFILQVRARQRREKQASVVGMGIPQHYGLLYSMGLGLCMEGILSACYHLCPNKMNFQFDSSFMYVIAVLVMLKLYQNRHSDLIPSAHSTFMVLAVIMSIGLFGILFPSVYFSVVFTILHLLTCFILTLKIYYAGDFKMEWSTIKSAWHSGRTVGLRAFIPDHRARAGLLALANVANWTFAIYCVYSRNTDLARQLLAILMGNAILYALFYLCMKAAHRECIAGHTWLYAACAHVAWAGAAALFVNGNTRWSETPSSSRVRNGMCISLRLLDAHDLWHVASAAAMFVSFNMLLTVDDPLAATPRHRIATF